MIDTPQGFEDRLAALVVNKDVGRERRRFGASAILTLSGAVLFVVGIVLFFHSAAESGFSAYISLVLSDSGALLAHFREFALSLAESIPAFPLALILAALALFAAAAVSSLRAARRSRLIRSHFLVL